MPFERLDDLEQAGAALALTGGLIAIVPEAQLLLYGPPGWKGALALMLLAMAVVGIAVAIASHRSLGGALAVVAGAPLVVFGSTTGGVLALIGGSLLVLGGGKDPSRTSGSVDREASVERIDQEAPVER